MAHLNTTRTYISILSTDVMPFSVLIHAGLILAALQQQTLNNDFSLPDFLVI
jgi:hypothetical protein